MKPYVSKDRNSARRAGLCNRRSSANSVSGLTLVNFDPQICRVGLSYTHHQKNSCKNCQKESIHRNESWWVGLTWWDTQMIQVSRSTKHVTRARTGFVAVTDRPNSHDCGYSSNSDALHLLVPAPLADGCTTQGYIHTDRCDDCP